MQLSATDIPVSSLLAQSALLPLIKQYAVAVVSRPQQLLHTSIADQAYVVQLPITFTPYAGSKACSARCGFCSENLRFADFTAAAQLPMPNNYHRLLTAALGKLKHIPLGLSLSGLEFSDDHLWALKTLQVIQDWQLDGGTWTEKACYSNLAGFAQLDKAQQLIEQLHALALDRLEVSRHHYDQAINQQIMNFRNDQTIQSNHCFNRVLNQLKPLFPLSLVCIVQQQGINSFAELLNYLAWAKQLGIQKVIFRELSAIGDPRYQQNRTLRFINQQRIAIEPLLEQAFKYSAQLGWRPLQVETGYYYWNMLWQTADCQVVFERSDYSIMQQSHASHHLHKLVFHANGNLSGDWTPERFVIFRSQHE